MTRINAKDSDTNLKLAHSCAAPARSNVRSAPERSALPKTRRHAHAQRCEAMIHQLGNRKSSPRLSAHGLVMAEAAFPHEVCPGPREEQPARLHRQRLNKVDSV